MTDRRAGARPADLLQFTGLRGLAALLVLFGHVRTPQGLTLDFSLLDPFAKYGGLGVDVFFVLSGFIMSHVYVDRELRNQAVLREFFVARFARIYPLHLATMILMLGAYFVSRRLDVTPSEDSGYGVAAVLLSLVLLSEWFGMVAPNPGSWSISVEFANYLIFPFVSPAIAKLRKWAPLAIVAGAAILAFVDDSRLVRGIAEFIMGSGAFYCAREFKIRGVAWLTAPLFVGPFLLPAAGIHVQYWHVAACFAGTVFLLETGSPREPFRRFCSLRPIVYIGEISYSVYLLQWLIWVGWKHVIARTEMFAPHPYLMVLCASITVIAASAISYAAFERPARFWIRERLVSRKWSDQTDAAAAMRYQTAFTR